ncbi:MBL fold metallo-hydrolase [Anaerovorax odorimutans]|uniref:MBL fold metallo-hydrolase n=1 Tax=Anaerovorax odorimutans TaxID=109327 RepID=A0ABT1RRE2_9FIRM|nr:MBL fold metallo-hydrolase [Anaerovorax odorimutans]MCQ4637760.1 MBL fold metallo-hydrolase [Anaerovorax odorimutans]
MRFKFLMENKTEGSGCVAEHGLSIYIEAQGRKLLFDTGASPLFAENAKKMGVDLSQVETLIISHGHYDHTGGVPQFCEINKIAPIYIHQGAFYETYGKKNGKWEEQTSGIRWSDHERSQIDPRIVRTDQVTWLSEDIAISGTIPKIPGFEPTETFYRRYEDGSCEPDPMDHEQILVIKEPEGLYVFSGCSHRGVVPAIRYAREIFDGERIAVLVAGMHLYSAGKDMRRKVVEQVLKEEMDLVMPVHCTGIDAICDLKAALGDKCVVATAGSSYGY